MSVTCEDPKMPGTTCAPVVESVFTPLVPWLPIVSILFCIYLIVNLPLLTQLRFVGWLALGIVIYFSYSVRYSRVRKLTPPGA